MEQVTEKDRSTTPSLSTVKTHLAALMAKLAVRNRVELALWAYETGRLAAGAR